MAFDPQAPSSGAGASASEEVLYLQVVDQSTDTFYKDEGGRQAHIQIDVKITNPKGLDLSRIPLVLQLNYENGYAVQNQEILATIMAQHLETDNRGGAVIRFRIEEVSKNHRSQKFVVRILADTSRLHSMPTIQPADSRPILVLSKRKDRKRKSLPDAVSPAEMPPWVGMRAAAPGGSAQQSPLLLRATSGGSGGGVPAHAQYGVGVLSREVSRGTSGGGGAIPGGPPHRQVSLSIMYPYGGGAPALSAAGASAAAAAAAAAAEARPRVIPAELGRLGSAVVDMLHDLEWDIVGLRTDPHTGAPDPGAPILQCHQCHAVTLHGRGGATHAEGCALHALLRACDAACCGGSGAAGSAAAAAAGGAARQQQQHESKGGGGGGDGSAAEQQQHSGIHAIIRAADDYPLSSSGATAARSGAAAAVPSVGTTFLFPAQNAAALQQQQQQVAPLAEQQPRRVPTVVAADVAATAATLKRAAAAAAAGASGGRAPANPVHHQLFTLAAKT